MPKMKWSDFIIDDFLVLLETYGQGIPHQVINETGGCPV